MEYQYNDGGREDVGYVGKAGDCVVRAIAIAVEKPYQEVYDSLNELAKIERTGVRKKRKSSSRTGVYKTTYHKYLTQLGIEWVPTMIFGEGCKVHLSENELPKEGRLIVRISKHITALIDGVINDTYPLDERNGTRCVYGYYLVK